MASTDLIFFAASAWAVDLELGVAAGVLADLPNAAPIGNDRSSWFPGGELRTTFEANFGAAGLRATWVSAAGPGADTVYYYDERWKVSDDHWAFLASSGLLVGPAVRFPATSPVQAVFSASAGVMALGTFHDFGGETQILLDPEQNDLDNPDNIDPYTLQALPVFDLAGGFRTGKRVALTVELGYTAAHVPAKVLEGSPSEAGAKRTALALNAVRLAVGVTVPLGAGTPAVPLGAGKADVPPARTPSRTPSPPESAQ